MARYKEYGYDIQDGKAIIPEWETEIKEEAFDGCKELTSVEFPQWIKKIGKSAFSGCSSLTSISIPPSVKKIWDLNKFELVDSERKVTYRAQLEQACNMFPANTVYLVGIGGTIDRY